MQQNHSYYIGRNYKEVEKELQKQGFPNTTLIPQKDIKKASDRYLGKVAALTIDGNSKFSKGDWFDMMSNIAIIYHDFVD